ncbi:MULTISPECIES: sensor histidine kinase [Sphingobacterium]|jgi:signal transduction histidine kinase|uniref:histidine kinase n=2 Tax=Sphingobacterium TaxID=28453 RepID=A0ABW5Z0V7_9SPHI|nr:MULTISPECIES: ATP-binding protein [Sphingobacterium]MBB2953649.1 signal transduction histidine kinase [Sphingobacterium sp. JUb56]MCS3554787.1 signal transduction histidine kinase [Sphingobacterium sp. JUb21]MCW2262704.1 signal transduction histidine kinase [Sphingobacterium kitahiroshimense]NJI73659.1 two-component sensor histidine kinase [Sphingobacterium sp. B16(2022)]QQD15984.1 two-component sensor histidine kinase [Sphingobacterium sp. UDSM-2020]
MKKALVLFYFLVFYATSQLIWWGVMLARFQPQRKSMIIGEGIFFLLIFLWGALRLKKLFVREQKLQQQQQNFLLAITHELKSPLASVKLYIQTILKRDLDKEQQQVFLRNSLKDIERLDDLVENVLITTKLESRNYNLPKEKFNLTELVEQIVDRLQKNACRTQVLKPNLDSDVMIYADKFAISNVVTNLIENAIKYSPPCANVVVKLTNEEHGIIFSVADHGIGISDVEKKLIFNKFYRVGSEATRKTKGTGLGLYIVKTVLQKHNASIKVKDNTPSGSIFEVTFDKNAK